MKIGIDYTPVASNPAGIGQYTRSLVSELLQIDKVNEYYIYSTTPLLLPNAKNVVIPFPKIFPGKGIRWIRKVAKHAKATNLDLFISPTNLLFSQFFPKTIQFVYDLSPIYFPNFFGKKTSLIYKVLLKIASKKALRLITISQTVKNELIGYLKLKVDNISVIYPGLNFWLTAPTKTNAELKLPQELPENYLLYVGTLEPRKNLATLLKAFHKLKEAKEYMDTKLVIVGKKGWQFDEIFKQVTALQLNPFVVFMGYLEDDVLGHVYSKAKGFVYISYYEGFGMPPIEAMYYNLPCLVSEIPVFREILGDEVLYVNPLDEVAIADKMKELLQTLPKQTRSTITEKYSWANSASEFLNIINNGR